MLLRNHLWSHLILEFCLLEVFLSLGQFDYLWLACSYFLFLSGSVFEGYSFLRVFLFLLVCPLYWQVLFATASFNPLGRSIFIPIPKKGNAKEYSKYHTTEFILHASKVMLKILQARLQQHMNWELPEVEFGFGKCRRTREQIANIHWIIEKAKEFQKNT